MPQRTPSRALAGAGSRGRAALLVALFVLPTLLAVPPASGQTVREIILDRRDVLEGGNVTMYLRGFDPTDVVEVRCKFDAQKCPAYTAPARRKLVFPDDFGEQARRYHEPRWNASYYVHILNNLGIPVTPPDQVRFNSTIVDVWKFEDDQVETGDRIVISSSGYLRDDLPVRIDITKQNASSTTRRDVIWSASGVYPENGTVRATFRFNKEAAPLLRCPDDPYERCRWFRVDVTSGSKNLEQTNFYVRPARIEPAVIEQPAPDPAQVVIVNRTSAVDATFRLEYRSGFEWVLWLDYPQGQGPRYTIERYRADVEPDGVEDPVVVFSGAARWSDAAFGWRANWTVPRDAPLEDGNGVPYHYRFVVPSQQDPLKNDIERFAFNGFRISEFQIPLRFDKMPPRVERTEKAEWILNLSYADGTPFTDDDADSHVRFCVYPKVEERNQFPCLNRPTIDAEYLGGALWRVQETWRIDDKRVGQDWVIAPAWTAAAPVEDDYGNTLAHGPRRLFNLSVASPRVSFQTHVDGEKREGELPLERGDLVKITADIKYPDGTTPFNRTRNADGAKLPLNIVQRNSLGDVVAVHVLNLTNPGNRQTWVGEFRLGRTAEESPAGQWRFQLDLADKATPPNVNATTFERKVVQASILATTSRDVPSTADIGDTIQYRFKLAYRDGTPITGDDLGVTVRAEVRPLRHGVLHAPIATLAPYWDRSEWVAEWRIPVNLPLERYVVVPSGQDLHGNVVRGDVTSRPVLLTTDTFVRSVLYQPPPLVSRGERVSVVFEGREGDVGPDGTGDPLILVQRYDSKHRDWVNERLSILLPDEPGEEHVGLWNTTLQTQAGVYRFFLYGKDASFAFINATSREFAVQAVDVSRVALTNGTNVTKGSSISGAIVKEPGDVVVDAYIVQDGKRIAHADNRRTEGDRMVASWTVPYTFPTGAFSLVIKARDRNGNDAYGEVGPFFVSAADIRSETVVDPVRIVPRGGTATWVFRSFYEDVGGRPTDQRLGGRSGSPQVVVYDAEGPVATARVRTDGPNYVAQWEVPRQAEIGDYWMEVEGRDLFGNQFKELRSTGFRTEPGVFGRTIKLLPPTPSPRDIETGFQVLSDPADLALEYVVVKLRADTAQAALNNFDGQVVTRGDVELSSDGTFWTAEWTPLKDAPIGWYRFRIQGTDVDGNRVEQWSGAFQVTPSQLPVFFRSQPRQIVPGEPFVTEFQVTYPDRTPLTDRTARVTAQVTRDEAPMAPEAVVAYAAPVWTATWDTPPELPPGRYRFVVSGFDILGNVVLRTGTTVVDYAPTNLEKLLGVPAPGILAVLAAAFVGLALRRR